MKLKLKMSQNFILILWFKVQETKQHFTTTRWLCSKIESKKQTFWKTKIQTFLTSFFKMWSYWRQRPETLHLILCIFQTFYSRQRLFEACELRNIRSISSPRRKTLGSAAIFYFNLLNVKFASLQKEKQSQKNTINICLSAFVQNTSNVVYFQNT